MKTLILLLFAALTLPAADATGTWTGSLIAPSASGSEESHSAHVVLKQDGTKVTGTAGPDESEQEPISNGKIEDGVITFDLVHGESLMKFNLKLDGGELKGTVTRQRDRATQTARLILKRKQ